MRTPLRSDCVLTLADVARALELSPVGGAAGQVTGVATDSRHVRPGDLFVARVGEQSDGHAYLDAALAAGAGALLVERLPQQAPTVPVLQVEDSTRALGQLARFHRRRLGMPLVAVTGSNGKTTTKEMLAAIFAAHAGGRDRVLVTPGNFNNHVGVPLTLLAGGAQQRLGVVELGMNAPGEIDALTALVEPQVGLITNASEAHLARFGTVDGVARAKAELWERLPPEACAVVPLDDPHLSALASDFAGRTMTFGEAAEADVRIAQIRTAAPSTLEVTLRVAATTVTVDLPLVGHHNAWNAAAAAAAALALGLDMAVVERGLPQTRLPPHRAQLLDLAGVTVLDDCYNANPASVRAALNSLRDLPGDGRLGAVLGALRELGPDSAALHRALGSELAERGLAVVVGVGSEAVDLCDGARSAGVAEVVHVPDAATGAVEARRRFRAGDRVLVKGSRTVGLERLLKQWRQLLDQEEVA